jgi:hypothetical protein
VRLKHRLNEILELDYFNRNLAIASSGAGVLEKKRREAGGGGENAPRRVQEEKNHNHPFESRLVPRMTQPVYQAAFSIKHFACHMKNAPQMEYFYMFFQLVTKNHPKMLLRQDLMGPLTYCHLCQQ